MDGRDELTVGETRTQSAARWRIVFGVRTSVAALLGALVLAGVVAGAGSAAYSGKPGLIFFDMNNTIFAVRSSGGPLQALTEGDSQDNSPAVSPNGRKVAFTREDFLAIMNVDGTHLRLAFRPNGDEHDSQPVWSPDGSMLAFVRSGYGLGNTSQSGIWITTADHLGPAQLVTRGVPGEQVEPTWSPDGNSIAFVLVPASGGPSRIATIGVDGTGFKVITSGADSDQTPDWSPDGSKLVFVRWHGKSTYTRAPTLWVVPPDGGTPTRLMKTAATDIAPAWSPDGLKIVFQSTRTPHGALFTLDLGTGVVRRVLPQLGDIGHISWQPLR